MILDEGDQPWLAFGSYWSGIKLRKIDPATGGLSSEDETLYALAGRPRGPGLPGAVEAPFIIKRDGYYYLFVSFDACCRGVESTYNIRVGRSKELTGPYLDRDGTSMLAGGGTLVLAGSERWRGPGHNAILQEDGVERLVYHAYDAESGGVSKLRIETLLWDEEGWPHP